MKRFRNILFARSARQSEVALAHALALAKHNQAGLTFLETPGEIPDVSVFGLPNEVTNQLKQAALEHSAQDLEQLNALRSRQGGADEIEIEFQVVEGIRFLTIIREVLRNGHDLVIKVAEGGEGLVSRLFSSTDMHLLRKCPCPLWLVKPDGSKAIRQIVAAVDFDFANGESLNDDLNLQIMEMAVSLAHREGARLDVVHAWQSMRDLPYYGFEFDSLANMHVLSETKEDIAKRKASRQHHLATLMQRVRNEVGVDIFAATEPKTHAIRGNAQDVIVEQARSLEADLVVMGTVGRVGIPGFFIGNTAESILNQIDCSVLALKPAGFESPVTLE